MSHGILKIAPAVPADAPKPRPGETAWFAGNVLPARHGVYRRLSVAGYTLFSVWDGSYWRWNRNTVHLAAQDRTGEPSLVQTLPWCGLAAPARKTGAA